MANTVTIGYFIIIQSTQNEIYNGTIKVRIVCEHMQALSTFSYGDMVNAGDILGNAGNTGASSGVHLHMGLIVDGGSSTGYSHCRDPQMLYYGTITNTYGND